MSDYGSMDQVNPEVIDDMRDHVNATVGMHESAAWSDEQVLDHIDKSYAGGSAQFNRESTYGWTDPHAGDPL